MKTKPRLFIVATLVASVCALAQQADSTALPPPVVVVSSAPTIPAAEVISAMDDIAQILDNAAGQSEAYAFRFPQAAQYFNTRKEAFQTAAGIVRARSFMTSDGTVVAPTSPK